MIETETLQLLKERINLLSGSDNAKVEAEAFLILQFMQSQPLLKEAYQSIKRDKDNFQIDPLTERLNEIESQQVSMFCDIIIHMKDMILALQDDKRIKQLCGEIHSALSPLFDRFRVANEVVGQIKGILGPSSGILSTLQASIRRIYSSLIELEAIHFKHQYQDRDPCVYLQNLSKVFLSMYSEITGDKSISWDSAGRVALDITRASINALIIFNYEENNCNWSTDGLKTEAAPHSGEIDLIPQYLSELKMFSLTAGKFNIYHKEYFELLPKVTRIKEVRAYTAIDELETVIHHLQSFPTVFGAEKAKDSSKKIISNLQKLYLAIKEKILLPKESFSLLKRFQFRAQNYDRKRLYKIADETTQKEHDLTMELCGYLYDHGKIPIYNPRFGKSIPDVVDLNSISDPLIVEVKVIKTTRGRVLKGFNQIYKYVTTLSQTIGYLIIFNIYEGKQIILPEKIPFENGIMIFNLVIDLTESAASGSTMDPIIFSEAELKGVIGNEEQVEEIDTSGEEN